MSFNVELGFLQWGWFVLHSRVRRYVTSRLLRFLAARENRSGLWR